MSEATYNYGNVFQGMSNISEHEIAQLLHLTDDAQRFRELMMKYESAISEVRTKLEVLNRDMSLKYQRNPFESIKSRLKTPASIYEKLQRRNLPVTYDSIADNLTDIAGVRVICSFMDDIYMLADCLTSQDDITVIHRKDYLANPKDNGYRSLHLIVEVPIFLTDTKEYMKVEVQFRTISMDWWASLEHKIRYKKDVEITPEIAQELYDCAEMSAELDKRMETIQNTVFGDKEAMKNLT